MKWFQKDKLIAELKVFILENLDYNEGDEETFPSWGLSYGFDEGLKRILEKYID